MIMLGLTKVSVKQNGWFSKNLINVKREVYSE